MRTTTMPSTNAHGDESNVAHILSLNTTNDASDQSLDWRIGQPGGFSLSLTRTRWMRGRASRGMSASRAAPPPYKPHRRSPRSPAARVALFVLRQPSYVVSRVLGGCECCVSRGVECAGVRWGCFMRGMNQGTTGTSKWMESCGSLREPVSIQLSTLSIKMCLW